MFIEEIISKLKRGELRIPAFQRGFVWSPDEVAFLMDSIYKGYPFGSVLLWRTKNKLAQERHLGPFMVPEPTADYPIDYVLDGQQRLTSILGVFATGLPKTIDIDWKEIYYDLSSIDDSQASQFLALDPEEVDPKNHFPINIIFDSAEYRRMTHGLSEEQAGVLDVLQKRFQQAQFSYSMVETEEKQKIAIVFERINRKGQPLDTFQLLSAWTWSEEFDLKQQFEELAGELEPFGFQGVGEDTDLLLRCAAAVLEGKESAESLLLVSGTRVRDALPRIKKGIKASIDFLKANFGIERLENLPYPTMLIPLATFFESKEEDHPSLTDLQVKTLSEWFWRSAFSRRYSHATKRNLEADVREALKLRSGASSLGSFDVSLPESFFVDRRFISGTVDTKTFVLMLANQHPKSIVNGSEVQVAKVLNAGNKSEFHHLFPQAFLRNELKITDPNRVNCLANFCILSSADNKKVGGKRPSKYREKLAPNVEFYLPSNLIPASLFADSYDAFLRDRAAMLVAAAMHLMGKEEKEAPSLIVSS